MDLSGSEAALGQPGKNIVLIGIELARSQGPWRRQWGLGCLPEVFADRPASQSQLFANLAQAHAPCMQLVDALVELPLAQETSLGFPLLGRCGGVGGEWTLQRWRAPRRFRTFWCASSGGSVRQADVCPDEKAFDRLA